MIIQSLRLSPTNFCQKAVFACAIPFVVTQLAIGFVVHKVILFSLRIFEKLSKVKPPFAFPKKKEITLTLSQSFKMISKFQEQHRFPMNRDILDFNQDLLHAHLKSYMNLKRYKELYVFQGESLILPSEIQKLEDLFSSEQLNSSLCFCRSISYKSHISLSKILDALLQLKEKALKNPDYSDSYKELVRNTLAELTHTDCTDQTLVRAETILLQVSTELLDANNIAILLKSILCEYQKNLLLEITTTLYPREKHQADFFQEILKEFNSILGNPVPSRNLGAFWANITTNFDHKKCQIIKAFLREYKPVDFLFQKLANSYTPDPTIKKLFILMGPWFEKTIDGFDFENTEHAKMLMPEENRARYQEGDDFFMHNGAFNKGAIAFFLFHNGIFI
ncbi:MAG: hypothetical protein FJZ59_00145 [Chlamydiae bacterium]|nr:hypothetical protein [Chlamydiota bacterium]